MLTQMRQITVGVLLCALSSVGNCTAIQFTDDGTFSTDRWAFFIFPDTGASGYSFSTDESAGQPSPSGSFVSSIGGVVGNRATLVATYTAERYDPRVDGAIESIDFSIDVINRGDRQVGQFSDYPRASLNLTQYSDLYGGEVGLPFPSRPIPSSWQTLSWDGLTEDSLTFPYDPLHPDFSADGNPLTFGFVLSFLVSGDLPTQPMNGYVTDLGIDNWSVTVHTVPIPAVGTLIGPAFLAFGWMARKVR